MWPDSRGLGLECGFCCCCHSHSSILCLHLCHFHSEWLRPWILLLCYFRPWSDLMPRNDSWQLKGKRLPLLGGKAEGRKERGWWALSTNSKRWLRVSAKCTSLGLSQASLLGKAETKKLLFLSFCTKSRTVPSMVLCWELCSHMNLDIINNKAGIFVSIISLELFIKDIVDVWPFAML